MKNQKKNFRWFFVLVLIIFGVMTLASNGSAMMLKVGNAKEKAKAEANIVDEKGKKILKISLEGLEPDSVYTVWFVKTGPKREKIGVGKAPHSFMSNGEGKANFTAEVTDEQLQKGNLLRVSFNNDSNANNSDEANLTTAFYAPLMTLKSPAPTESLPPTP